MEASGWAPRLALLGGAAAAAAAAAAAPPAQNGYCDRGPKCHPPSLLGHYHPLAVYQQLLALAVMGPSGMPYDVLCQHCLLGNVDCTGTTFVTRLTYRCPW